MPKTVLDFAIYSVALIVMIALIFVQAKIEGCVNTAMLIIILVFLTSTKWR